MPLTIARPLLQILLSCKVSFQGRDLIEPFQRPRRGGANWIPPSKRTKSRGCKAKDAFGAHILDDDKQSALKNVFFCLFD